MKNWVYLILIVLFTMFLGFGCQKKATKVTPTVSTPTETKPETETKETKPTESKTPVEQAKNLVFYNIYFDYDKSEIRPDAREILAQHAKTLMENPKIKLLIEGHCDERGTIEYNLALGERRANAVKKYFVSYGLDANRFSIISYGKERPFDPRSTPEAWAKNRRAVFVIQE